MVSLQHIHYNAPAKKRKIVNSTKMCQNAWCIEIFAYLDMVTRCVIADIWNLFSTDKMWWRVQYFLERLNGSVAYCYRWYWSPSFRVFNYSMFYFFFVRFFIIFFSSFWHNWCLRANILYILRMYVCVYRDE